MKKNNPKMRIIFGSSLSKRYVEVNMFDPIYNNYVAYWRTFTVWDLLDIDGLYVDLLECLQVEIVKYYRGDNEIIARVFK